MNTYKDIEYTLRRSDRKTASIYIERDGEVSVLVPESLDESQIGELIESKRRWIYTGLAEWQDLNATRVQREFVSGEGFLYLGRSYRLQIVEEQDVPVKLKDGYFRLRSNDERSQDCFSAFKEFHRDKGRQRIPQRVAFYQSQFDVTPKSIKVVELQNRWASCSPNGNLSFHWKCMMAPLTVLDYIVVHELAHLIHPNHTEAFWNEVDKVLPDYGERKEWLRVNGAGMDL
jgi:predicted metal-dependent hydrolase